MSGGPEDMAAASREAAGVRRFPDPDAMATTTAGLLSGAALCDRNKHLEDIARVLLSAALTSAERASVQAASLAGGPLAGVAAEAAFEALRRATGRPT